MRFRAGRRDRTGAWRLVYSAVEHVRTLPTTGTYAAGART